ncbi:MAG: phosphoesterase [Arcobacteraceae bacterium]|nr:phosphoesterase [Arcobacteraceae bacterium]
MKLFHMSHTDLDGYGCQLISKKIYPNGNFYNANYGVEVKSTIKTILKEIEESSQIDIFFLISDLNLTVDESKNLTKSIENLNKNGKNIKLQLLDHHITGEPSALKYEWYFLDTKRSATKIVFDYFMENYESFPPLCTPEFKLLIEAIDDVDIWCEFDPYFEFGKVAMRIVTNANEINATLFPDENRDFRHHLLLKACEYITKENGHILLDDDAHHLKKEYLILDGKNNTIDNLSAKYLVYLLEHKKDDLTVYYKEHKGLLTYNLFSISISANTFLKENPDFDFFININKRGNAGFRAAGNVDVSLMAQKLANGGGHPNASGAYFDDFKETIDYQAVKRYINQKLSQID